MFFFRDDVVYDIMVVEKIFFKLIINYIGRNFYREGN